MLRLLDFNTVSGELPGWEVDKIPPLLAITTGGLARGLLRVPGTGRRCQTVDAISVPLRDGVRGRLADVLRLREPLATHGIARYAHDSARTPDRPICAEALRSRQ